MDKNIIAKSLYKVVTLYLDFKDDKLIDFSNKNVDFKIDQHEKASQSKVIFDTELNFTQSIVKRNVDEVNQEKIKEAKRALIKLAQTISSCRECSLHEGVRKVPGMGAVFSKLFVISYPPTEEEERQGFPMNSRTEDFFKKWLSAIEIDFNDVFITNLVKCPVKKRNLTKGMIETCWKYIDEQIKIVNPKIILTLGQVVLSSIKRGFCDIKKNHGVSFYYNNIPVIPTFHPDEVLANQALKRIVWEDLKKLKGLLKGCQGD